MVNIAMTLRETACRRPHQRAVVFPAGRDEAGRVTYSHFTFQQLDRESDRLARGLQAMGVVPGTRLVLMVRPSLEFIALTFALFKVGAVVVLIDPGMGGRRVFQCLDQVEPQGFVAIPLVHAARVLSFGRYKNARFNVTVGNRWFWSGPTYKDLLSPPSLSKGGPGGVALPPTDIPFSIATTQTTDPAAIIFTSGSTGPAKGVVYEHGMFAAQVEWIRDFYNIQAGEIDLPGFPLFALFNAAMGVTTVIPDMDPTRPAQVNPERIIEAIDNQGVTQAFGSPAIWNRVGRYCETHGIKLPSLRRVLSAGAPVPVPVMERMCKTFVADDADLHTPYGATESLPVCSISAREVLHDTAEKTRAGAGTCVGRPFPKVQMKIIEITEGPIESLSDSRELPHGEIGEIIVRGDVVTREYFRQTVATQRAKIADGDGFWHRMGDVGYLDATGRLWFCGRKSHIVETEQGRLYTDCCEPIFDAHPRVFRTALVGVGSKPLQAPVIIVEPEDGAFPRDAAAVSQFTRELQDLAIGNPITQRIEKFLFHPSLPVDVRHNVKINRELLAKWATSQINHKK